jgi:hypothetical protein
MTIKEQIISYCGILTEDAKANQVGLLILKLLKDINNKKESKESLFKRIDNITANKWFHVQSENKANKEVCFVISPMDEGSGDIKQLVVSNVPDENKEQVLQLFQEWFASRLSNLKNKYKGWTIYSYKRADGEMIRLA